MADGEGRLDAFRKHAPSLAERGHALSVVRLSRRLIAEPKIKMDYFGDPAEGLNNFCPSTSCAPIACCPAGETSQSAKIFAASSLATPCLLGVNSITS